MRINKFLATHTALSRRSADSAVQNGRVTIDGRQAQTGDTVPENSRVTVDGKLVQAQIQNRVVVALHKPVGYVCSRNGQGAPTVYDLLPIEHKSLRIAGRLDKDSSGLVILTNDGELLQELTHPSNTKEKIYHVTISGTLAPEETNDLLQGVDIGDERLSRFKNIRQLSEKTYEIILEEGRNRQIRRSFEAIGHSVTKLHRISLANYTLKDLPKKQYKLYS